MGHSGMVIFQISLSHTPCLSLNIYIYIEWIPSSSIRLASLGSMTNVRGSQQRLYLCGHLCSISLYEFRTQMRRCMNVEELVFVKSLSISRRYISREMESHCRRIRIRLILIVHREPRGVHHQMIRRHHRLSSTNLNRLIQIFDCSRMYPDIILIQANNIVFSRITHTNTNTNTFIEGWICII